MSDKSLLEEVLAAPAKKVPKKRKRKKSKTDVNVDPTRLHECSHTELIQLAELIDLQTSYATSKDEVIELILGTVEHEPDGVQKVREATWDYVNKNMAVISAALMRCQMQCLSCPSQQVLECYDSNRDVVEVDE